MGRRITIMVDDDNFKKLRLIQAKLIKQSVSSVSFSKVLNDTITECLKKNNPLKLKLDVLLGNLIMN